MMIHAYDETYLSSAQNILGHAVDFAIMSLNLDPDTFGNAFSVSSVSKQFAIGNPRYVAGMNGCELTRLVLDGTSLIQNGCHPRQKVQGTSGQNVHRNSLSDLLYLLKLCP